jgi:hypothetical protein
MALSRTTEASGLVVTRGDGVLTAFDLLARPGSTSPELLDLREVEDFPVTAEAIRELAEKIVRRAERSRPGRLAVLVSSDPVFGMFRMLQALVDGSGLELQVFREPREARAWLGVATPDR